MLINDGTIPNKNIVDRLKKEKKKNNIVIFVNTTLNYMKINFLTKLLYECELLASITVRNSLFNFVS